MPAMVLLIKGSESVEYMNPSAKNFLGNLCAKANKCTPDELTTKAKFLELIRQTIEDKRIGDTLETTFWESHLQYTIAPFKGYKGRFTLLVVHAGFH